MENLKENLPPKTTPPHIPHIPPQARKVGGASGPYLAGYLLRSGPALTRFRCSRNPAVTEPPSSVRIRMFRLEERILEKLLAMMKAGRRDRWPGRADEEPLVE